jgi:A118 family predicted phage portal protein
MFGNMVDKIKGWFTGMLGFFSKTKEINDIIETQISDLHYKEVEKWKSIYAGFYEEWHNMKYVTVAGQKKRRRHTLNMSKVSTSEMSRLIFSENVEINISDEQHNKNIEDLLKQNRFYKIFQEKVEQMLALGGLVLKAFPKEQPDGTYKLLISYITPDCFIPTSWENGCINEGAFLNITRKGEKIYCLFEIHKWEYIKNDAGVLTKLYTIQNKLFERDTKNTSLAKEIPLATLYPELQERASIEGLTQPLFQYAKPNIANNMDLQSPLGVSIFANALDTLFAIDVAFDSFIREFKLGKRRIIVPAQALRTIVDPTTGEMHRYFDADDEVFQGMNFADPEKQKIIDNTVSLRVDEHISAINSLLNLYSMQIGFSTGSFTFDGKQVKTATEVISENSKTYQTVKSNEHILEEVLEKFIATLTEVAALYKIFNLPNGGYEIDFNWDDSIVGDKYQDADYYIKLVQNSLSSKKHAIMKILGLTEDQADEMLKEIQDEESAAMPDINDVLAGGNPMDKLKGDPQPNKDLNKDLNKDPKKDQGNDE